MELPLVQLKKIRDFGDVFNDSFSFMRQEFKPLGKAVLKYALPWLIVAAILGVFVNIKQQQITNGLLAAGPSTNLSAVFGIYKYVFLAALINLMGMSALQCIIISYLKLYAQKGQGNLESGEVWNEARQYILPVIFISILVFFVVFIGFMLCIVPGIFLGVSLFAILYTYIIEEKNFADAFNRSIKLTSQNWWMTLGIILISIVLLYLIQIMFSIPAFIMGFRTLFFNITQQSAMNFSTGFYIVNSITTLASFLIYSILVIIMAFHYYSLVELKERPSLQDKIDNIS